MMPKKKYDPRKLVIFNKCQIISKKKFTINYLPDNLYYMLYNKYLDVRNLYE